MNDILQYLLKWSIALAVVYLFYRLALRPLTFYQWNRRYLIMYSLVAFIIPFINLTTYVQPQKLEGSALVQFIPTISIQTATAAATAQPATINYLLIAGLLILLGSLILSARLAMQWYSLRRIRRKAVRVYHPEATVYHVDEQVIPFSFGNAIYLNTSLHSETELNDIILHEFVHVRQKHSFDIIWSEILCILNWYNPFAWCIRHAIRQNLEFIADQAVLQHGLDKRTYQYHLLKVIGSPQYSIANNFNFSSLKKRIAMMNRLKSARVHLVKFLFVLPLLAVLLVAFRQNEGWYQDIKTDTIKKPDAVELRIVSMKEFYQMNPSVKEIGWSADDEIVIYLKNGQREAYRIKNEEDMKKYHANYKAIPSMISKVFMPPPPPPGPHKGEAVIVEEVIPGGKVKYYVEGKHEAQMKLVIKTNPNVATVSTHEDKMTIKMKDGTIEQYDFTKAADVERFEKKFGKVPPMVITPADLQEVPMKMIPPPAPKLPDGVTSLESDNKIITIRKNDGTVEKYDVSKPAEKEAMEKKYGLFISLEELPAIPAIKGQVATPVIIDAKTLPATPIKTNDVPGKPAVIETPGTPAKPVIQIRSSEDKRASVQMIQEDDEQTLYADKIVMIGDPEWKITPRGKANPVYYLNGKRSVSQDPNKIAAVDDVSHMEVIANPELVKAQGENNFNAIINIVTRENVHNKSAYLAKESKAIIADAKIAVVEVNNLVLDEDNPIDIKVEGVADENVEVEMTGGTVSKRNGRYYVRPNTTGNVEIRIYKKETGKERKLINKRVFRVVESKAPTT